MTFTPLWDYYVAMILFSSPLGWLRNCLWNTNGWLLTNTVCLSCIHVCKRECRLWKWKFIRASSKVGKTTPAFLNTYSRTNRNTKNLILMFEIRRVLIIIMHITFLISKHFQSIFSSRKFSPLHSRWCHHHHRHQPFCDEILSK